MTVMRPHAALAARIALVVSCIPAGEVSSYGDVALIVGGGCDARMVGYALGDLGLNEREVPWQRVVARDGAISTPGLRQRELLVAEGVAFDAQGRVLMVRHRWRGPDPAWCAAHGCLPLPLREAAQQLGLF